MATTTTDRRQGVNSGIGVKVPVKAATTAAITLSGEQTIDAQACVSGDRVLVKDQSDGAENGIYVVDTGDWARAEDWNGVFDFETGSLIHVWAGTANRGLWYLSTTGTITVGTTAVAFSRDSLISFGSGLPERVVVTDSAGVISASSELSWDEAGLALGLDSDADLALFTNGSGTAVTLAQFRRAASAINYPFFTVSETAKSVIFGTDGIDADINMALQPAGNGHVVLSSGVELDSYNLGTVTSGTVTPNPHTRALQHYTNNGAHTLAPSANEGSIILDITNDAAAGAITTTGFTFVDGDPFTTTNGDKFRCNIVTGNAGSLLLIQAMQ